MGKLLYKRWEGVLDRAICVTCANHDNEVVEADKPFRYGDVPGEVHPNCRCQEVVAINQYDLDLAHAVTREVAGPGIGRAAVGKSGSEGLRRINMVIYVPGSEGVSPSKRPTQSKGSPAHDLPVFERALTSS